ncbi:MAG: hypothetical protein ACRBHB_18045 [Arenicella sp.]
MMNQDRKITIEFPARVPTWNAVLTMSLRQRMRLKKLTRQLFSLSRITERDSQIQTGSARSGLLMQSLKQEYCQTITPASSEKSGKGKSKATWKEQLLKSKHVRVISEHN